MAYKERALTREEYLFAMYVRDFVPRKIRLEFCQRVADVAEDMRERATATIEEAPQQHEEIRKRVWDTLAFPRYRFFDVAIPNEGWAQFAEVLEES